MFGVSEAGPGTAEVDPGLRRRWVLWAFPIVVICVVAAVLFSEFQSTDTVSGTLPPDLCTLVPASLLARVVPSAQESDGELNLGGLESTSRCFESSHVTSANPPSEAATGSLDLTLNRFARSNANSAAGRAQTDFAAGKRRALAGAPAVHDIADLGDSAYVTVSGVTSTDGSHLFAGASVRVLFDNADLEVSFFGADSTTPLAMSAAVTVARALIGQLR
jgi:hypothetical protein